MKDNRILTLNEIEAVSLDVFKKYNLLNVRIFGSYAKGIATQKSDVDFLVKFKDGASLFDLYDLKEDLKRKLKKKVDILTLQSAKENAILDYEAVMKESVVIYES